MSYATEAQRRAKEIRQRLRYPPNAVPDCGIDLTRKSSAAPEEPPPQPEAPSITRIRVRVFIEKPTLRFSTIMAVVAQYYGLTIEQLCSSSRSANITMARHISVYLGDKLLGRSLCAMGRDINRDHTSVLNGRRRIIKLVFNNPQVAETIDIITAKLGFYARHNRSPALAALSKSYLAAEEIRLQGQAGVSQPGIYDVDQTSRNPVDEPAVLATGHKGSVQGGDWSLPTEPAAAGPGQQQQDPA